MLSKFPRQYRTGDRRTLGHAGHVILCNHAENLGMPRCLGSGVDPSVVGPQGPRGDVMRGWFFSSHSIINVTNGLSPLFRRPNWVRRHWGFRDPTLGLTHVHLEPVSSGTVACSSSTQGMVGRTSRGH